MVTRPTGKRTWATSVLLTPESYNLLREGRTERSNRPGVLPPEKAIAMAM